MSEHQTGHEGGHAEEHHEGGGHHINYFGIYVTLVVLFLISVAGPEIGELTGLRWITLVTAFGIAIVKARLVIDNFMHLKWERRIMKSILVTSLVLMALMVAGISTDVLNHEGRNWENVAAREAIARGVGGGHGEEMLAEGEEAEEAVEAAFNAQNMFNIVCASCHGTAGDGTGAAGAALDPAPANFTDPAFWETRDMDRVVNVITNGAAAAFGGSALMVGWSSSFDEEQIQQLAEYVSEFRPE
jgi:caa(3)-type oxidase subunit IV